MIEQGQAQTFRRFDRMMALIAWACRPALYLFPLLVLGEMAGLVAMEVTIPFAAMAAIHAAGRRYLPHDRDKDVGALGTATVIVLQPQPISLRRDR